MVGLVHSHIIRLEIDRTSLTRLEDGRWIADWRIHGTCRAGIVVRSGPQATPEEAVLALLRQPEAERRGPAEEIQLLLRSARLFGLVGSEFPLCDGDREHPCRHATAAPAGGWRCRLGLGLAGTNDDDDPRGCDKFAPVVCGDLLVSYVEEEDGR